MNAPKITLSPFFVTDSQSLITAAIVLGLEVNNLRDTMAKKAQGVARGPSQDTILEAGLREFSQHIVQLRDADKSIS